MHERERENKKDRFGIYLGTQMSPNFQNSQTLQNLQKPSFGISELTNSKNPKFRKFPKSPKLLLILYGSFRTFGTLRIVEISCERLVLGGWHMCICLLPLALKYNMYIYIYTYIHTYTSAGSESGRPRRPLPRLVSERKGRWAWSPERKQLLLPGPFTRLEGEPRLGTPVCWLSERCYVRLFVT